MPGLCDAMSCSSIYASTCKHKALTRVSFPEQVLGTTSNYANHSLGHGCSWQTSGECNAVSCSSIYASICSFPEEMLGEELQNDANQGVGAWQ